MSNEIQTVITILIVFAMVLLGIRTIKNYGIKSKNSASMFIGFIIGSLVGYYFLNSSSENRPPRIIRSSSATDSSGL